MLSGLVCRGVKNMQVKVWKYAEKITKYTDKFAKNRQ